MREPFMDSHILSGGSRLDVAAELNLDNALKIEIINTWYNFLATKGFKNETDMK